MMPDVFRSSQVRIRRDLNGLDLAALTYIVDVDNKFVNGNIGVTAAKAHKVGKSRSAVEDAAPAPREPAGHHARRAQ
jgi:hypothetical protein